MNPLQPKKYADYTQLVTGDAITVLEQQVTEFPDFLATLASKADYTYAPGKWTIKEIAGHIIDTERILVYRLTAFARGEQSPLPGFDEDQYVANSRFHERSLVSFADEFILLRKANLFLFRSLSIEELSRTGVASGKEITVQRLLLTIAGHLVHHVGIIKERYI